MDAAERELVWAAGFFDGEGCVGAYTYKGKPHYLQISLPQNDPRPLERFAAAVGIGKVIGPQDRTKFNPNAGQRWVYQVYRQKVIDVMEQLRPYLTGPKLEQYERALEVTHQLPKLT